MTTRSADWVATARLLRRTGFGTSGPLVDAVVAEGAEPYLDRVLALDPEADPGAVATPMPDHGPVPEYPSEDAPKADKDAFNAMIDTQAMEFTHWWLQRMNSVVEPIHEKLTFLWHNHFATSAVKVRFVTYMAAQNRTLRAMKLGPFGDLAFAMLTDAAMLSWLDGKDNVAESPNENLSREFMELFALGHGNGYSEADVKEGARALTGWDADAGGRSAVREELHDVNPKTVLGVTGELDASSFCNAVLAQGNSPTYVASRLWRQLASDSPPSADTLARLVGAYGPGGDLRALTKAILLDPEFASSRSTTMPVEWMIGMARTLKVDLVAEQATYAVDGILTGLGQRPFYPPDVSGWRVAGWVSTGSIAAQLWAATKLAELGDVSGVEQASRGERIDAVGYLMGVGAWSDRTVEALKDYVDDPRKLFAVAANTPEYLTS